MKDYNQQFHKKSKKIPLILVAVVVMLTVLLSAVFFGQTSEHTQAYRTISVIEVSGKVSVVKDGIEYSAYPGMLLQEGHEIVTSGGSYVRLVLDNDKYVKLEAGSKLTFEKLGLLGSGKTRMYLHRGALTNELVNPLGEEEEYIINTPNAVLAVRGTFFRVDLGISTKGDVRADVMTYGGQVASQRVLPTGEIVEEEVLIDAGFKAAINMTQEDTHYIVEIDDEETIIVEPNAPTVPVAPTQPITTVDISDDDLVDVYFAAENGHELFVTAEEAMADIEVREIKIEEKTSVYEKAEELKTEQEANKIKEDGVSNTTSASVIANDSKPIAMVPEIKEESNSGENNTNSSNNTSSTTNLVTDGEAHKHEKATKRVEPTCMQAGQEILYCRSCNKNLSITELPAAGHVEINGASADAHKKCSACGLVLSTSHKYEITTIEASCTQIGEKTYACNCGYAYKETSAALGHTVTAGGTENLHSYCSVCDETLEIEHEMTMQVEKEGTCSNPTMLKYSCDCGYYYTTSEGYGGHDWGEWEEVSYPTCEEAGENRRECNICYETERETLPATGHTEINVGTQNVHSICGICDEVLSAEHNMVNTAYTAPSCTDAGSSTYACDCGYTYTNKVAALGHNFAEEFTIDVEVTCTTDGSKSKHCSQCDGKSEVTAIPALGHDYTDFREIVAPTCTTDGEQTKTCRHNECPSVISESIPATGHTEIDGGTQNVHSVCETCGIVLSAEHNMVNTAYAAPSCTNAGSDTYTCDCGYTYTNEVPALGHNFAEEFIIDVAATCTTDGSKSKHCSQCDGKSEVTAIPALGHTEIDGGTQNAHSICETCDETLETAHEMTMQVEEEGTCSSPTVLKYSCDCGYFYTTSAGYGDHDWGEWEEVSYPTCEEAGENRRECNICYETERETLPATGHIEINGGTQNVHSVCETCGIVLSAEHNMVNTAYAAPSCTNAGSDTYACDCGYTYTNEVPALGHNFAEEFTIDVEVTCTTDGSKSKHCSQCSETSEVTVISATGHSTTFGGTEEQHTFCAVCMETLSNVHAYTDTEALAATCETDGVMTHACECGYEYTTVIDAFGHNYVEKEEVGDDGYTTSYEECENCGDIINENTVLLLDAEIFPDEEFRVFLDSVACNTDGEEGLTREEVAAITSLTLKGDGDDGQISADGKIRDLTGIEYLTELTSLDVSYNANLSTLDVSANTKLTSLVASGSGITSIDTSGCSQLQTLVLDYCDGLSTLDISDNGALVELVICNTNLTTFNAGAGYYPVTWLDIRNSGITSIDMDKFYEVQILKVDANLTELNLNACQYLLDICVAPGTALKELYVVNTQNLNSLTFEGWNEITTIRIPQASGIRTLDLSDCPELTTLDVPGIGVTTLDLSQNVGLTSLNMNGSSSIVSLSLYNNENLDALDVTNCSLLQSLSIPGLPITSLDLTGCTMLKTLEAYDCAILNQINLSDCTSLTSLDISRTPITGFAQSAQEGYLVVPDTDTATLLSLSLNNTSIDYSSMSQDEYTWWGALQDLSLGNAGVTQTHWSTISQHVPDSLTTLNLTGSTIENIDLSGYTQLSILTLYDCTTLTTLDAVGCTALTNIVYTNCQNLTSVDISGCTSIRSIAINELPAIETFNASGCTSATSFNAYTNGATLETLDISDCTSLTALDTSKLTNLSTLIISGSGLDEVDLTNNTALTTLTADGSALTALDVTMCTNITDVNVANCASLLEFNAEYCSNLSWLNLSNCTTLDRVILTACTSLTGLGQSAQKNYIVVPNTATVTYLDLTQTSINYTNASADKYTWFGNLETLKISNASITDAHWEKIKTYLPDTIKVLEIADNTITTLDVRNYTELTGLRISRCSSLTSIDLSKNTELTNLECANSNLTTLDLSNNTKLTNLTIGGASLAFPDLSKNTALTALSVSIEGLTSLDVSGLTGLYEFSIDGADITEINLTANASLGIFYAGNCAELETVSLPSSAPFEYIGVWYCDKITTLDFSESTVQYVEVGECSTLTALDLSGCSNLVDLRAPSCYALKELNLENCTNLCSAALGYSDSITTFDLTNTGSAVESLVFNVTSGSTTETSLQNNSEWNNDKMSISPAY